MTPKTIAREAAEMAGQLTSLPAHRTVRWRHELAEVECYHDAVGLVFRIIREVEAEERPTRVKPSAGNDQLALLRLAE